MIPQTHRLLLDSIYLGNEAAAANEVVRGTLFFRRTRTGPWIPVVSLIASSNANSGPSIRLGGVELPSGADVSLRAIAMNTDDQFTVGNVNGFLIR